MRRVALALALLTAALAVAWSWLSDPPAAEALTPADVVGVYRVKVRGFAATQGQEPDGIRARYRDTRVRETGLLVLSLPQTDDGTPRVRVQLTFDRAPSGGSTLAAVSPDPPVQSTGFLVGNSLSVIDAGSREYANTLVVQFQKNGKKISGVWASAFHGWDAELPSDARQREFTSRLHAVVVGKRLRVKAGQLGSSDFAALRR